MSKTYKVSYKTYLNDRLKQVNFHGTMTHPLYIQVTFDRKPVYFKSYYFELFSRPRYVTFAAGMKGAPTLKQVIEKEEVLLDFVADKTISNFSLELFKKEYDYYCQDLLDVTEPGFIEYLFTFFQDKGMPALATAVREGCRFRFAFDVVRDMKRAFQKPLYDELVENSFYYAPPYFPLYGFMEKIKRWPMLILTVMEWEDEKIRKEFEEYIFKYYSKREADEALQAVNKWLVNLKA